MTLAFFTCWLPYAVLCLYSMLGGRGPASIFVLPILFAKSSIVWNPLLYIFFNDEVSRQLISCLMSDPTPPSPLLEQFQIDEIYVYYEAAPGCKEF